MQRPLSGKELDRFKNEKEGRRVGSQGIRRVMARDEVTETGKG